MSAATDVADAVKDYLNANVLSGVTAIRRNVYSSRVDKQSTAEVCVVPLETEVSETGSTRASLIRRVRLVVYVTTKIDSKEDTLTQEDVAIDLAESIENGLYNQAIGDYRFVALDEVSGSRTTLNVDDMVTQGYYRTAVELTYFAA